MNSTSLTTTIRANQAFFISYGLLALAGLYPLLAYDKTTLFLKINAVHHPVLDQFCYYITNLGSGLTYGLLLVVLWLGRVHYSKLFIGASSFVVTAAIVQALKRIVFPGQLRPIAFIPDPNQLHLVDQVTILRHLSFPSGHAATIFTAACFLNLIAPTKHPGYSISWLLIATIVAYSRVYLCQHFYTDVYMGALIGGGTAVLVYAWLQDRPLPAWLAKRLPVKL